MGALYGSRVWRVQYYDAQTGGNPLGAAATGTTMVDHEGRWSIVLTPPAEVLGATGEVWYELAIDSGPAPDGTLSAQDVFPDRVKVESVLFAQRALVADQAPQADSATTASVAQNALALGGLAPADFATTSALALGLATKSDTTHLHNLQDLGGAVTDGQVPDSITIDHAADADTATTATMALAVLGDTVTHSTIADVATVALTVAGDEVGFADLATTATTAENALALGGLAPTDYATTSALTSGLAAKSDTTHSHNLQDLGGAVTDGQVPDSITINHAADADTATTATMALAVLGDTVTHSTIADVATVALTVAGDEVGFADLATTATTAENALALGGLAPTDYATTSALTSGLAAKSDTTHSHNLQDLGGAVTDGQVPDSITISSAGSVDAAALKSGTVPSARLSLADSDVPNDLTISGGTLNDTPIGASTPSTGAFTTLAADTLDTGQGANELYAMDQNVRTSDAVTFASASVVGSAVLDQKQTHAGFQAGFGMPGSSDLAQTFTAAVTGEVEKVVLMLIRSSAYPSTVSLAIYTGSTPGSGSQTGSTATVLVTEGSLTSYEFAFATPPAVVAGQEYYLYLTAPVSTTVGMDSGLYADGQLFAYGTIWQSVSIMDIFFQEYVRSPGDNLVVNGAVRIQDSTSAPSTPADRLYNNGGNLYWNGTQLDEPLETPIGGTLLMVGDGTTVSQDGMAIGASANGVWGGHAMGYQANARGYGTAMGYRANGSYDGVAVGYGANAYSGFAGYHGAVAVGYRANAFGSTGAVVGSVAIGQSANAGHDNDTEDAVGAVAIGLYANAYNQGVAIGGSFAEFTNGVLMHAPQTNSKKTAAANEGVAVGYNSYADDYGVALGFRSRGYNSGTAVGYRANAGDLPYTFAKGRYSRCMRYGEEWKGADSIPDNSLDGTLIGYNHFGYGAVNFFGVTMDAVATEIYLGGSSGKRFVVQDDCGVNFTVHTVAVNTVTGDTSVWQQAGGIKRREGADTTALVGSISSALSNTQGALTTAPALTADTTNGSLKVAVTGTNSNVVLWNVVVRYSEVRQ